MMPQGVVNVGRFHVRHGTNGGMITKEKKRKPGELCEKMA